ncbi:MAG: 4a-hydroxytetrahydrobiopterin dehydratase [Gammaproteobacteria bacterium]|nr:4a-hydroxytetrahydrobiopterin dehydratase [Gammaproteobacteria bacterium]
MHYPTIDACWMIERNATGLTRRFEFASYSDTRRFLDELADLSERTGYYPNLNFNRTLVNVSIESDKGKLRLTDYEFAAQTDALLAENLSQETHQNGC